MPYGDGAAVKWPPCVCAGIYLERSAKVGGKDEEVGEVDLVVSVVVVGGVVAETVCSRVEVPGEAEEVFEVDVSIFVGVSRFSGFGRDRSRLKRETVALGCSGNS